MGSDCAEIDLEGSKLRIDFQEMKQRNLTTGFVRPIRCVCVEVQGLVCFCRPLGKFMYFDLLFFCLFLTAKLLILILRHISAEENFQNNSLPLQISKN